MSDRVRALLITPVGDLLTVRRVSPGQDPYWVLPGGGVEAGEDLESALARELHEEIAGRPAGWPPRRPASRPSRSGRSVSTRRLAAGFW